MSMSEHTILLHDPTPIQRKGYTVPLKIIEDTRKEIDKLKKLGIIRNSKSNFCSPAFPILKKNGNIRLVVDYRQFNKQTLPTVYPLPLIHYYLQQLNGSKVFSQIDLNMGYYQIPIRESDVYKTGFTICNETYEFLRMPFGLANAPRTFQRTMQELLLSLNFTKVYLDDILIHSKREEEHLQHLKQVFEILRKAGASINFEKSHFNQQSVCSLGNIIAADGIKPDISKVCNFNIIKPKNKKQLQRILGLVNWFRPYIINISEKISEINSKLENSKKFT